MPNMPSGPGPSDKQHSISITTATDDPGSVAEQNIDADLDAVKSGLTEKDQLTSASAGAGGVFVIAVTTTSAAIDLSGANYTALKAAIVAGKRLRMVADFDLWYRWGTATGTVDETATAASTPLNQAESLYASERVRRLPPPTATWLMVKGEVDTYLRITIAE
jgi:hypothetical protein